MATGLSSWENAPYPLQSSNPEAPLHSEKNKRWQTISNIPHFLILACTHVVWWIQRLYQRRQRRRIQTRNLRRGLQCSHLRNQQWQFQAGHLWLQNLVSIWDRHISFIFHCEGSRARQLLLRRLWCRTHNLHAHLVDHETVRYRRFFLVP